MICLPREIFIQDINFLAFRLTLWPGRYQGGSLQQACTLQFSAFIAKIACEIGDPKIPLVFLFVWILKDQFKTLVFLITHLRMAGEQLRYNYCLMFLRVKTNSGSDRTSRSLYSHLLLTKGIVLRSDLTAQGFILLDFGYLHSWRLRSLFGLPVPVLGCPQSQEFFPHI